MSDKKVVYVEDNLANLRFMQKVLKRRENILLLCAENALEGIELIRREQPDLVLMDIQMPGMNGYEAYEELQQDESTCSIPVVAVSANAMDSDISYARSLGFVDYVTKPIDIRLLDETLDAILLAR